MYYPRKGYPKQSGMSADAGDVMEGGRMPAEAGDAVDRAVEGSELATHVGAYTFNARATESSKRRKRALSRQLQM